MALPASAVWEVRPTVGSDTACGGGFDPAVTSPGTDYSQQNAAQYTFSDLASISSLVVASVSHNFVAADVGNFMQITAGTGFTTGFYEIVSVAANQATLDRSPGTVGVGGTYCVGGALATISAAVVVAVASNKVWVKATGTYTVTAALSLTLTNGNPFTVAGYTTTRGDNGRVTWTTATNSVNLIEAGSGTPTGYAFLNFTFTNTAGTPGDCFHAKSSEGRMFRARNCSMSGFNVGINGNFQVDYDFKTFVCESCEIKSSVSHGIFNTGVMVLLGCTVHNNGGDGIRMNPQSGIICTLIAICTAIKSNTGNGVYYNSTDAASIPILINCDIINNVDGVNIEDTGSVGGLIAWNAILDSNSGFGINFALSANFVGLLGLLDNAFRNNSSGNYNNISGDASDITLTADPFTNRTGTPPDLSLNSTSGGGTACKGAATPQTLPFS